MDPPLHARARDVAGSFSQELLGAVIVIATDGLILAWNDGATRLFGYSEAEAVGRSVFETIVPKELAEAKRIALAAAVLAGQGSYEAIRSRRDGLRMWVDVTVRVHRGDDGVALLVLHERDITRPKYQREAEVLQTRFRGVLDAAPDAIVLVDTTGRMALVNAGTERLFGYGRGELLGEPVELLVPARYHKGHPAHRSKYFRDPQTRGMGSGLELSGRRKDGSEFPVEISLSPLTIDAAQLAMAAIRDVSTRKLTEEALKAANEQLEAFTYSVSHDLRAPIRQIDGFSRILAEKLGADIDTQTKHYLDRIRDGTQYMGRLVDDLLHLAQLGRQDIRPRLVSLNDVARGVVSEMQAELSGRKIEWKVGALPTVECDPGLVKIVFTNLIANAVKYTRPRDATVIEVGTRSHHGQPAFFVRDNGVGFDMKYADKLFGVFQRLHRAEEFEGTGVGLATVQRIVHKHGGEIWAEAALDKGATFVFTLGRGAPPPESTSA